MSAQSSIDVFMQEVDDGNTDFVRFLSENEQAKLLTTHMIEDFKQWANARIDVKTEYSVQFHIDLRMGHSYLFQNALFKKYINIE